MPICPPSDQPKTMVSATPSLSRNSMAAVLRESGSRVAALRIGRVAGLSVTRQIEGDEAMILRDLSLASDCGKRHGRTNCHGSEHWYAAVAASPRLRGRHGMWLSSVGESRCSSTIFMRKATAQRRGTSSAPSRNQALTKMELGQRSVRGIFQQEQGYLPCH